MILASAYLRPDLISFNTWLSTYQKDTPALEKRAARLFSLSQMVTLLASEEFAMNLAELSNTPDVWK